MFVQYSIGTKERYLYNTIDDIVLCCRQERKDPPRPDEKTEELRTYRKAHDSDIRNNAWRIFGDSAIDREDVPDC